MRAPCKQSQSLLAAVWLISPSPSMLADGTWAKLKNHIKVHSEWIFPKTVSVIWSFFIVHCFWLVRFELVNWSVLNGVKHLESSLFELGGNVGSNHCYTDSGWYQIYLGVIFVQCQPFSCELLNSVPPCVYFGSLDCSLMSRRPVTCSSVLVQLVWRVFLNCDFWVFFLISVFHHLFRLKCADRFWFFF